jgi:hypothetical protein
MHRRIILQAAIPILSIDHMGRPAALRDQRHIPA